MNFHPHLHDPVTEGVFTPAGWFVAFPKIDLSALERLYDGGPCYESYRTPFGR